MPLKNSFYLAVILIVFATTSLDIEARRLKIRPLSAREVYRILKEAGREDAIPEGRVVTQGLAAMTGFALGITKGVGGSLLFDLATSNATTEFLNNFNLTGLTGDFQGLNMTAFTQMFKGGSSTSSGNTTYQTQEICFSSRSLEPGEQGRSAGNEDNNKESERQASTTPATTTGPTTSVTPTGTGTTPTSPGTSPGTASPTTSYSPTTGTTYYPTTSYSGTAPISSSPTSGSTSVTPTTTSYSSPTSGTGSGTTTGTTSGTDTGTDTNTNTNTVTNTGTGNSQTCIVIQKPTKSRRRRSSRLLRH